MGTDDGSATPRRGIPGGNRHDFRLKEHGTHPRPIDDVDPERDDRHLRHDEPQPNLIGLVDRTVDAWPRTFRLVFLLVVTALLVGGLLWFVPVAVEAGPFSITPQ
ncbi:hypothetical protein ACFYOT_40135 [Saccharothrix saharensis]|uniref:hypothetical protein n=1 Tax=Saccharothrix saharensis TaxID=571190 RepID=UPI0036BC57F0